MAHRAGGHVTLAAAAREQAVAGPCKRAPSPPRLRPAALADIPALVDIENRVFAGDRVDARCFRHLLTRGNAATLVDAQDGALRAYGTLLFNRRSTRARLYSFAVVPEHRGKGIAKILLAALEKIARARGCDYLRLEVRRDNPEAQALYRKAGYRPFGLVPGYYEDHMDALRMEKALS